MGLLKSRRQKNLRKLCFGGSKFSSDSNHFRRLDDRAETKTCGTRGGCVPVYIGEQKMRYEVPLQYISFNKFQELILESFGGDLEFVKNEGPIELPNCTTEKFYEILNEAEKNYRNTTNVTH
ncbi:hypothetical protein ACLB2K_060661 [Fragaria x ananassa]